MGFLRIWRDSRSRPHPRRGHPRRCSRHGGGKGLVAHGRRSAGAANPEPCAASTFPLPVVRHFVTARFFHFFGAWGRAEQVQYYSGEMRRGRLRRYPPRAPRVVATGGCSVPGTGHLHLLYDGRGGAERPISGAFEFNLSSSAGGKVPPECRASPLRRPFAAGAPGDRLLPRCGACPRGAGSNAGGAHRPARGASRVFSLPAPRHGDAGGWARAKGREAVRAKEEARCGQQERAGGDGVGDQHIEHTPETPWGAEEGLFAVTMAPGVWSPPLAPLGCPIDVTVTALQVPNQPRGAARVGRVAANQPLGRPGQPCLVRHTTRNAVCCRAAERDRHSAAATAHGVQRISSETSRPFGGLQRRAHRICQRQRRRQVSLPPRCEQPAGSGPRLRLRRGGRVIPAKSYSPPQLRLREPAAGMGGRVLRWPDRTRPSALDRAVILVATQTERGVSVLLHPERAAGSRRRARCGWRRGAGACSASPTASWEMRRVIMTAGLWLVGCETRIRTTQEAVPQQG